MKINVGCGTIYVPGWVNLDAVVRDDTHPDLVVDPADPFRDVDGKAERVYLGHVLEHVPWADVPRLLGQVRDILTEGGSVLVVGPDVRRTLARWKDGLEPDWLAEAVLEGDHHWVPADDPGTHKWNCHEARVVGVLERVGFSEVTPTEDFDGWPVSNWTPWQCAVAARK